MRSEMLLWLLAAVGFGSLSSSAGEPKPGLDSIRFDATGYEAPEDQDGTRVWYSREGDGLGLFFFDLPPDVPTDAANFDAIKDFYTKRLPPEKITLVEFERITLDGLPCLWMIL